MKTRLLKTPDLPSQSLGWASNTPQHLRIAGHWVSSHVGYSACGNQMLLRLCVLATLAATLLFGALLRAVSRRHVREAAV